MVCLLSVFSLPFYGVTPSRGAERKRATVARRQQRDLAGPRRATPARSPEGPKQSGRHPWPVVIGDLVSCRCNPILL